MAFTRRHWLTLAPIAGIAGIAGLYGVRRVLAATVVGVPNHSIGAIVAATGGDLLEVQVDSNLADDQIAIGGGIAVTISERILRKGEGLARSRFLDDARNATKIASNVKAALTHAMPDLADDFAANHLAWAKPFATDAVAWTKQLAKLGLGQFRDDHGRIYLLEWAGATIDPDADPSPSGLARVPEQPSKPTLEAYRDYLDDLIAALS